MYIFKPFFCCLAKVEIMRGISKCNFKKLQKTVEQHPPPPQHHHHHHVVHRIDGDISNPYEGVDRQDLYVRKLRGELKKYSFVELEII